MAIVNIILNKKTDIRGIPYAVQLRCEWEDGVAKLDVLERVQAVAFGELSITSSAISACLLSGRINKLGDIQGLFDASMQLKFFTANGQAIVNDSDFQRFLGAAPAEQNPNRLFYSNEKSKRKMSDQAVGLGLEYTKENVTKEALNSHNGFRANF